MDTRDIVDIFNRFDISLIKDESKYKISTLGSITNLNYKVEIDDKKFVSITLNNLSLNEKNFISADQLINSDLLKKKLDINIYEHLNLISKLKVPLTEA